MEDRGAERMKFNYCCPWLLRRLIIVAGLMGWVSVAGAIQAELGSPPLDEVSGSSTFAQSTAASAAIAGTIHELRARIQGREVTELRTTYNGRYGASLLLNQETMVYYVTLFSGGQFWRAVKLDDEQAAEKLYGEFARTTQALANIEIHRLKLEGQKAAINRQVSESEARLRSMQSDLVIQRQQERVLIKGEQAERDRISELEGEYAAASNRLGSLETQIQTLGAEQRSADSSEVNCFKTSDAKVPATDCKR